jgi:hypothetical protein
MSQGSKTQVAFRAGSLSGTAYLRQFDCLVVAGLMILNYCNGFCAVGFLLPSKQPNNHFHPMIPDTTSLKVTQTEPPLYYVQVSHQHQPHCQLEIPKDQLRNGHDFYSGLFGRWRVLSQGMQNILCFRNNS